MVNKNIAVAALHSPELESYSIRNDGKVIHVYEAELIRILSQIFRVSYKIYSPSDKEFGVQLPDGNWTGMIGMVKRSEVDFAVGGISITNSRFEAVKFSYPYHFTSATFMTDKPKAYPKSLALIHPFPLMLWVLLITVSFLFSCVLYLHVYRKQTYQTILFMLFGSLLEKSIDIHLRKSSLKFIIGIWFMFTFVITNSYKAVLLSILTVPNLTGIRDIPDLAKAAEQNSVACYTFKGSLYQKKFLESGIDTWRSIGKCLEQNSILSDDSEKEVFFKAPSNKAFIASRSSLKAYKEMYLISEDSFFNDMRGIPVSRKFCCLSHLNKKIQRLFEAGVFQKIEKDKQFFQQLKSTHSDTNDSGTYKILELRDFKGIFIVLLAGYALSLLVFFIEIAEKRHFPKSNVCFIKKKKRMMKMRKKLTKLRLQKLTTIF